MLHSYLFSLIGHVLCSQTYLFLGGVRRNWLLCNLSPDIRQFQSVLQQFIGILIISVLLDIAGHLIEKMFLLRVGVAHIEALAAYYQVTFIFYLKRS